MRHYLALDAFDVGGLGDSVGGLGAVQLRLAAVRTLARTRHRVWAWPGRVGADLDATDMMARPIINKLAGWDKSLSQEL